MHVSLVSATPESGKPEAAAGRDDAATGFDALLASLLLPANAAADLLADPLPLAEPAADSTPPGRADADALQSLLASLPPTHALAAAASADSEPRPEEGIADIGKALPEDALPAAAPGRLPQAAEPVSGRTGAGSAPASSHQASGADTMVDRKPDSLPLSDGAPAQSRHAEHAAHLPENPSLLAAEPRAAPPAMEPTARHGALPVATPLASPAWGQAFAEQVVWVARAELQSASLTLNPPKLGPVKIELTLDEHQASASFISAQPEVRKAMEEALPTLKALFADAGLNLAQANIGGGHGQSRHDHQGRSGNGTPASPPAAASGSAAAGMPGARPSRGLLDTFA